MKSPKPERGPAECELTGLGVFDVGQYGALFGTSFTSRTLDNGWRLYGSDAGPNARYDFVIDSDRDDDAIVQASAQIFDVQKPISASAQEDLDLWAETIGKCQPEAIAWIEPQLSDFIAAPGAEISEEEAFGEGSRAITVSFGTLPDFLGPDPTFYNAAWWAVETIGD